MKLADFGEVRMVTAITGAKTILKSMHSLLQNKCISFGLFVVRRQKIHSVMDASYSSPFYSILHSQNYFLYNKSYLHSSSIIVKLYLSHWLLQSCNNNIYVVYIQRKSTKSIKRWMPHILAECRNKNPFIPLQFKLLYTTFKHASFVNAVHHLITLFFLMWQWCLDLWQSFQIAYSM